MKYYVSLLMALPLLGCANTKSISNNCNTRIFSETTSEVNKAIINYLTDDGWQIICFDMKIGLIKTNLRQILFKGIKPETRLSFRLQPLSNIKTKVEVNVFHHFASANNGEGKINLPSLCFNKQELDESEAIEYYEQIFKKIEEYLKH